MNMLENDLDSEVQRQIEREVRMREGAWKLLAACSQREQALEASKSLLTCNARILGLLSQLQRVKEAQVLSKAGRRPSDARALDSRLPCTGKVLISDLRIPLMWKDSEYFKNKGELHRCAVFCLLHCGREILDTDLVMVDRTLTDICFEEAILFSEVGPDFVLRVELYSSCLEEDFNPGAAGPRRLSRLGLSGSLGRSSGRKLRAALETAAGCGAVSSGGGPEGGAGGGSIPQVPACCSQGPKYHLLAHTTLKLAHVQDSFRTHDLSISTTEDSSYWLPLYGSMCCRLVAQPSCMTRKVICGSLKVKLENEPERWTDVYGVLKGTHLMIFQSQEDMEAGEEVLFTIAMNKDTSICVSERGSLHQPQNICINTNQLGEEKTHTLATPLPQDTQQWMEAFGQHFYDMSQWQQCCDELMKLDLPTSRKPLLVIPKQGSLYHEIVTSPSHTEGQVIPDVSAEIRSLLSSYYNDSY